MELFNVIKFDGIPNRKWIMYKYPGNSILNQSTLIVGTGQIAVAVHGGKIEKIFESGTYKLSTENYPFLRGLIKSVHGGNVPFTMEIYFFNATVSLKNVWGTASPIQMIDPKYGIRVDVRANGQYALKVSDFEKFFTLLMGAAGDKSFYDFNEVAELFRGIICSKATIVLGEYIVKSKVSFLEISTYLGEISTAIHQPLKVEFEKYGLTITDFYVAAINVPKSDLEKLNEILNRRAEFDIMGDDRYRTMRSFDILEKAAENEGGAGTFAAAGLGLGIGIAGVPLASKMMEPAQQSCPKCGGAIPASAKFCPNCGAAKLRYCPNCGMESGGAFCPSCGSKL